MYIYGNKKQLFQWDLNQKIVVEDKEVKEVHFSNATTDKALVVEVVNGMANIPNILLQNIFDIKAYGFCGECVREAATFNVIPRVKPDDYLYVETVTWSSLKEDLDNGLKEFNTIAANALKKTATDIRFLAIEDISPMEHTLEVKLEAKNLLPRFSTQSANGVSLQRDTTTPAVILKGMPTQNTCFTYDIKCKKTGVYYLKDFATGTFEDSDKHPRLEVWNRTQKKGYSTHQNSASDTVIEFTLNMGDELKVAIWAFKNFNYVDCKLYPIMQLKEIPQTYTEYIEDYTKVKLTVRGDSTPDVLYANKDGTVDGVVNIYPNTYLDCSALVYVTATYNRDINKAFKELTDAIISLGGSV